MFWSGSVSNAQHIIVHSKIARSHAMPLLIDTVEPPNKDHLGEKVFVPCREAVPISEASESFFSPLFHHFTLIYSYI